MRSFDIIGLGECMLEFIPTKGNRFIQSFGGDVLNTLIAASQLGAKTSFITKVGDDRFKNFLLTAWRRYNIDLSYTKTIEGYNGLYFIDLQKNGNPIFQYYRKGSAATNLAKSDICFEHILRTKIVYSTGITQAISKSAKAAVKFLFKTAKSLNKIVAYDINYRHNLISKKAAKQNFFEICKFIDILLPSYNDTEIFDKKYSPEKQIEFFFSLGINIVILKAGKSGCYAGENKKIRHIRFLANDEPVDTTGAGDAFNGGFLYGKVTGQTFDESVMLGLRIARKKIRHKGAIIKA